MSKLLPLKIPSGWAVIKNNLINSPNDDWKTEDILSLEQMKYSAEKGWVIDKNGLFIDLGWYPDSDPNGNYKAVIGRDWNNIFAEFESKDKEQMVKVINNWLDMVQKNVTAEDFQKLNSQDEKLNL